MSMKHWCSNTDRGKQNYWEKNLSGVTLSTTNPSALRSTGFLCDRPANDSLSHGTTDSTCFAHGWYVGCLGLLVPVGKLRLKCDGTRAETRFRLSRETDESI